VPVEHSRYLAEHIDHARYVEVRSQNDDPEAVAAAIAEFLTGAKPVVPSGRVLATHRPTCCDRWEACLCGGDRRVDLGTGSRIMF
jgi:hypothetical protein